jgi:hypothetical protein
MLDAESDYEVSHHVIFSIFTSSLMYLNILLGTPFLNSLSFRVKTEVSHAYQTTDTILILCIPIRVSSGESNHKIKNQVVHPTQWLESYSHAIVGKVDSSPIINMIFLMCLPSNLKCCIKLCKRYTLSYSPRNPVVE